MAVEEGALKAVAAIELIRAGRQERFEQSLKKIEEAAAKIKKKEEREQEKERSRSRDSERGRDRDTKRGRSRR